MKEQKILLVIESLDQGYVVTDYIVDKKYAVEYSEGVLRILKEALGIPEPSSEPSLSFTTPAMPHGTAPQPTEEITEPKQAALQKPIEEMAARSTSILPSDLLIPRFEYDMAQKKEIQGYKNISVVEMPDGRAVVMYKGTHYYTTKEKALQIPYPIPRGFLKKAGLSSSARTCIRAYRHYLATAEKPIGAAADGKDIDTDACSIERTEKLEAISKVNENRWKKGKAEEKRLKKTAELREMAINMGVK